MSMEQMPRPEDLPSFQFTPRSEESFYAVVDHPDFFERDSHLIYYALQHRLKLIPFGDYLKRYIYRKAEIQEPFEEVSNSEYLNIIADSFASRGVPVSFRPSVARIRSMAKNWITQSTVSRDAVLLLGFGLKMGLADVEELLTKGLSEPRLNLMDERECICAYCYDRGLGFYKYESLMHTCCDSRTETEDRLPAVRDSSDIPRPVRSLTEIRTEKDLLRHIAALKTLHAQSSPEQEAKRQFDRLYRQAQEITAAILNAIEKDSTDRQEKKPDNNPVQEKTDTDRTTANPSVLDTGTLLRQWTADEITPSDMERVLQAATPRDRHGNMVPMKKSTLNSLFRGRRMNRKRLGELLYEEAQVTRYDLIMMQFFVFSQQKKEEESKLQYYYRFMRLTNEMLAVCGMGPLYSANPFECFLLMCVLSEDPLGTYADVIEKSYAEADE